MPKVCTKSFCVKMTPEDHAQLEAAMQRTGQSMSAIVRTLIRAYLVPQLRDGRLFGGVGLPAKSPVEAQAELPLAED